ncbi:Probable N(2),N(2)-dimethylguanosine tRNA methyltransferase [Camponotus floridanus]|uniref:tRNA (guanine(26)-N(2))-dimethyltransferase n=1 Tax=Camponotus floridanus TaxID=104421 RepID=E2AB22_CAMFO|nr:Probable N(2),N(2)-dimethylguanosine tRNA methyltransferase [Camponotus floridanus]
MTEEKCAKKLKLEEFPVLSEGKAQIIITNKKVFYNPVQEFNRDLSIAVLTIFAQDRWNKMIEKNNLTNDNKTTILLDTGLNTNKQEGITILEALSATGLRSIRYAKEVKGIKQIVANDISAKAVDSIRHNVLHNGVENLVTPHHEDATLLMYQRRRNRFDAVDLDPYGCPSMYLDGAVQCVADGGILLVTATDMAVLAGNTPETCYYKYGAISIKSKSCHEIALRILLQCIASYAGRYGRYIVPLLSISIDFYIRVFVKVFTGHNKCKENSSKIGMLYQCNGCESMSFQPLATKRSSNNYKLPNAPTVDQLCKHCQYRQHMAGPIWLGSLHDQEFVSQLLCNLNNIELGTSKRMEGVLTMIHEELDVPLYYTLDRLMSIVKCDVPSILKFRSALLNAGYKVSYSHASKTSIKTDASNDVIWDIVRAWEKEHPAKREKLAEDSPAARILNASFTRDISFAEHPLANPISRQRHLSRFQQNPTVNWGPGVRATIRVDLENKAESKKNDLKIIKQNERTSDINISNVLMFTIKDCLLPTIIMPDIPTVTFSNGYKMPMLGLGTYKLWNTFHREELVVPTCKKSLANLGLEYIDLYLVHWPFAFQEGDDLMPKDKNGKLIESDIDYLETWRGMEECVRQGLTRSIGISNFNSEQINRLLESAKIAPVNNQIEININVNQEKLIDFCKKRNITITGYSPLGQPGNSSGIENKLDSSVVLKIAEKYNKTPAQVALRYVFQHGVAPIPKSVTKSRIKENMEFFDFTLTSDEMNAIRKLGTGERVAYFSTGKVFKYFPFNIPF